MDEDGVFGVSNMTQAEQERRDKIARIQQLVEAGRASGISDESMEDIRARALRRYRMETAHTDNDGPAE